MAFICCQLIYFFMLLSTHCTSHGGVNFVIITANTVQIVLVSLGIVVFHHFAFKPVSSFTYFFVLVVAVTVNNPCLSMHI